MSLTIFPPTIETLPVPISEGGTGASTASGARTNLGTVPGTNNFGYQNLPQNSKSADYILALTDSGKQIYHPASDANARQFTIPKNATVAFALGTVVTFTNDSANDITVIIDTDTLEYADTGAVTTITIPQYNTMTIQKTTTTTWLGSGTSGVTTA